MATGLDGRRAVVSISSGCSSSRQPAAGDSAPRWSRRSRPGPGGVAPASLHLWVTTTNEPALRLYRRAGFRPTGRTQPSITRPRCRSSRWCATYDPAGPGGGRASTPAGGDAEGARDGHLRHDSHPAGHTAVPEQARSRGHAPARGRGGAPHRERQEPPAVALRRGRGSRDASEARRARADRRARRPGGGRGGRRGGQDPVRRLGREPRDPVHAARRVGGWRRIELGGLRWAGGGQDASRDSGQARPAGDPPARLPGAGRGARARRTGSRSGRLPIGSDTASPSSKTSPSSRPAVRTLRGAGQGSGWSRGARPRARRRGAAGS